MVKQEQNSQKFYFRLFLKGLGKLTKGVQKLLNK